ncbi:Glycoside hydrolase superfamily [Phytophthora cactorum]|nr:Glycoside hydrolase superfamily [Phytophthora cactorum]
MRFSTATLGIAVVTHAVHGFLECRQPNYLAKGGKILAVDPDDASVQTEIRIKGVSWGGMEKIDMIPDGCGGTQATTISKLQDFLDSNGFNSIRLSLNADYTPLSYIHGYENPELTTWDDPEHVDYVNFLARVVETLQNRKLTVLLEIHRLTKYEQDAFWYTNPFVKVTESGAYKAATYLAEKLCGSRFWNIIGIDLKDEMLRAQWNADPEDSDETTDWHQAAGIMADAVLERCPQWLVFVGGASSFTDAQRFVLTRTTDSATTGTANATLNPSREHENKIVLAPHAHAHGVYPQNYCTPQSPTARRLPRSHIEAGETLCVDFINGTKTESKLGCSDSHVACSSYEHISIPETLKNYETVMKEALGDLPDNSDTPLVLGAFSGVYGKTQPHQTAVLAYLIDFAASVQGGYFYALNPDTERYLEDSADGKAGTFAVTHYGLMQTSSWQEPNADLLEALQRIPSTEIPCYGGKETNSAATIARDSAFMLAGIAATTIFLVIDFIVSVFLSTVVIKLLCMAWRQPAHLFGPNLSDRAMMEEVLELLASDSPSQDRSASTTASNTTDNGLNRSSISDSNHDEDDDDNGWRSGNTEDTGDQAGTRLSSPSNDDSVEEKNPAEHRTGQEQEQTPLDLVQQMKNSMNAGLLEFFGGDLAASAPNVPPPAAALPAIPGQAAVAAPIPIASQRSVARRSTSPHDKPGASASDATSKVLPTGQRVHVMNSAEFDELRRKLQMQTASRGCRKRKKEAARQQKTQIQELQAELARLQDIEAQTKQYQLRPIESLLKELKTHQDEVADLSEKGQDAAKKELDWGVPIPFR